MAVAGGVLVVFGDALRVHRAVGVDEKENRLWVKEEKERRGGVCE